MPSSYKSSFSEHAHLAEWGPCRLKAVGISTTATFHVFPCGTFSSAVSCSPASLIAFKNKKLSVSSLHAPSPAVKLPKDYVKLLGFRMPPPQGNSIPTHSRAKVSLLFSRVDQLLCPSARRKCVGFATVYQPSSHCFSGLWHRAGTVVLRESPGFLLCPVHSWELENSHNSIPREPMCA